ncbi:winged helix-turn-helix transcriptional regulator [Virgibacillus halodenitrificans]|uniref:helix-turn-helix domain-containing protein n=1 Tax=Virgibacillus halodenitrificans TaxID=1482 RepID=UPI00136DAA1E|nr:helix-turn-helix domain-containing protein [Virgibacillus halodenitrificans]MYL44402.1 winged helix-turn-helix transcriptional regulator [Virgibacillus halodenitrificans]
MINDKKAPVYTRTYTTMFDSGLIKEIGTGGYTVLSALASFMNDEGECYPTQRQLAEMLGMSKTTVNNTIKKLLAVRVNGKPILTYEEHYNQRGYKNYKYKVHPISQVGIFKSKSEFVDNTAKIYSVPIKKN